jgi:hypothetical protein
MSNASLLKLAYAIMESGDRIINPQSGAVLATVIICTLFSSSYCKGQRIFEHQSQDNALLLLDYDFRDRSLRGSQIIGF